MKVTCLLTTAAILGSASAFSANNNKDAAQASRRSFLARGAALVGASLILPEPASAILGKIPKDGVVQTEMKSFSNLIYNFKDVTLNGLDASKLKEPSVPFIEFGERMKKGEVAFVEFIAPNGDAAYATFKATNDDKDPKPIRIGQGYPTESKDSWTSPAYVIRSVSNFNVPYKFTVPAPLVKFQLAPGSRSLSKSCDQHIRRKFPSENLSTSSLYPILDCLDDAVLMVKSHDVVSLVGRGA